MIKTYKHLSVFLPLLFLLGCEQPPKSITEKIESKDTITVQHLITEIKSKVTESGDSLIIQGICAVLYIPDSIKISKIKQQSSEQDFSISVDDNSWYLAKARKFLREQGVNVVDTKKKQIVFLKDNGKRTVFSTDNPELDWGFLLFDGVREPVHGDLIDAEDVYVQYFSIK